MRQLDRIKMIMVMTAILSAVFLPGCVKGTSDIFVEEMELCAATELSISNPLGNIKVVGAELNNMDGTVFVKTEKYVDAYSLFGFATPNEYVNQIKVTPTMDNGRVEMAVEMAARGLLERLFVRIVPHVNRTIEAPTLISTNAELQFGDVELRNLPEDVKASVSVGTVTADMPVGVVGEQRFDINVGQLELRLPKHAGFEYDLKVDVGKTESPDFDLNLKRRLLGVHASGLAGGLDRPGLVTAKVNIGFIAVKQQQPPPVN